jgi:flagellar biosynthetic protein FliR
MTISVAQAQLFFLALTRILAILVHVPVLAGPSVPNQVKIGLGVLLTIVMLPWEPLPPETQSWTTFAFGLAVGREVIVGTLAGYAAALTFGVLQITAELMGQGSGFSAGRVLNPTMGTTGAAMDQLFVLTAILIFFVLNGHHAFLLGIQKTFTVLPLNQPIPELSPQMVMRLAADTVAAGIQISMPVLGAVLLTDLCLGLLARVAPQMQVYFLGVPLKVGIGLLALSVSLGMFAPHLASIFDALGDNMLRLLRGA